MVELVGIALPYPKTGKSLNRGKSQNAQNT
jgi:hypothetical protein